jgi:hypothetical protein
MGSFRDRPFEGLTPFQGDAKSYEMAVANQKRARRRRFWMLVGSIVMAAVGIRLR